MADNANRKAYSFDDDDPDKGVRISSEIEQTDEDGRLQVPQQVVVVGFGSVRGEPRVSLQSSRRVTINIGLFEANDSAALEVDLVAPSITVLAKLRRVEEILMRGTLYESGMETNRGVVVDPYRSELNEDGTYNTAAMVTMNVLLPDVVRAPPRAIARTKTGELDLPVDPVRDIAVLYGVSATYTVEIPDRDAITLGPIVEHEGIS